MSKLSSALSELLDSAQREYGNRNNIFALNEHRNYLEMDSFDGAALLKMYFSEIALQMH